MYFYIIILPDGPIENFITGINSIDNSTPLPTNLPTWNPTSVPSKILSRRPSRKHTRRHIKVQQLYLHKIQMLTNLQNVNQLVN